MTRTRLHKIRNEHLKNILGLHELLKSSESLPHMAVLEAGC